MSHLKATYTCDPRPLDSGPAEAQWRKPRVKQQQEHGASLCAPSPSPAAGRVEGPVALRPAATARVTPAPRVPTAARQEACTPSSHRPGQVAGTPAFPCARDCPPPCHVERHGRGRHHRSPERTCLPRPRGDPSPRQLRPDPRPAHSRRAAPCCRVTADL